MALFSEGLAAPYDVVGGCGKDSNYCYTSPGYPSPYPLHSSGCMIDIDTNDKVEIAKTGQFMTQQGADILEIGGVSFSGGTGPQQGFPVTSALTWKQGGQFHFHGWQVCLCSRSQSSMLPPCEKSTREHLRVDGTCQKEGSCYMSPDYPSATARGGKHCVIHVDVEKGATVTNVSAGANSGAVIADRVFYDNVGDLLRNTIFNTTVYINMHEAGMDPWKFCLGDAPASVIKEMNEGIRGPGGGIGGSDTFEGITTDAPTTSTRDEDESAGGNSANSENGGGDSTNGGGSSTNGGGSSTTGGENIAVGGSKGGDGGDDTANDPAAKKDPAGPGEPVPMEDSDGSGNGNAAAVGWGTAGILALGGGGAGAAYYFGVMKKKKAAAAGGERKPLNP